MNYLRSWESLRCALSSLVKTKGVFISCSNANKRQPPFSVLCTQEYLHCFLSIKLTTIPTCKLFLTLYNYHNCYALFSAFTSVSHFILFFNTSVKSTSRLISRNTKEEHKIVKQKRVTKATAKMIGLTFLYQRRLRARNCTTQRFSYLALDTGFISSRPYNGFAASIVYRPFPTLFNDILWKKNLLYKFLGSFSERSLKSFPVFPHKGILMAFLLEVVHIIHHIIMNLKVAVFFFCRI